MPPAQVRLFAEAEVAGHSMRWRPQRLELGNVSPKSSHARTHARAMCLLGPIAPCRRALVALTGLR